MSSKIPKASQPPLKMKDKNADDNLKPQKENVPKKSAAGKGVSTRYNQVAELKGQIAHLLAQNEQMQDDYAESQQEVTLLRQKCGDMQTTISDIEKRLNDCNVFYLAQKLDPVSGEAIAQGVEDRSKEIMENTRVYLEQLKEHSNISSRHDEQLRVFQAALGDLSEERERTMEEREAFSAEILEMGKALEEIEQLL